MTIERLSLHVLVDEYGESLGSKLKGDVGEVYQNNVWNEKRQPEIHDLVDRVYSDVQRLDAIGDYKSLNFSDLITFNDPQLAFEQIVNALLKDREDVSLEDLKFISFNGHRLMGLIEDNPQKSISEVVEDLIDEYCMRETLITCGEMREIALRIPLDLDLLLTSKFAAFPGDPYIVFTLRLMGVYNHESFLQMMEPCDDSKPFHEAVMDFVNRWESIISTMTVNHYLKILLALPDKTVHLKKVLFHQGGICYKQVNQTVIARYADLEVLGVASVPDMIRILFPVKKRKENLLSFLTKWIKTERESAAKRSCSEQRHIWSFLLTPDEDSKICGESVLPFFMHEGGPLYHTDNSKLTKLHGKHFNYLGVGLLPFWEERMRKEEVRNPGITVVEVIEKVIRENAGAIANYNEITKDKVELLLMFKRGCEKEIKTELVKAYNARPDIFYSLLHSEVERRSDFMQSFLHYLPDLCIQYMEEKDFHLLEEFTVEKAALLLSAVPWAWGAFPRWLIDEFSRGKREFSGWEQVLCNPLSWSKMLEHPVSEESYSRITNLPVVRLVVNELDEQKRSDFRVFIDRMVSGDRVLVEKVEKLYKLGALSWKMFIDPKHHKYGPYVFDKGYHGGLVEEGYLKGMYAGLLWCAFRLSREELPDEEFEAYKTLNRIVYSHNYRKIGGQLRRDEVLPQNNTKVSKRTLQMEKEGISEWDPRVAFPVVPTESIEGMMADQTDTADRFTIQFQKSLDIKKYLKEEIYIPYNQEIRVGKKRRRVIEATARKHKMKELLHVFRDGVSRSNWLELNLDMVRHGQEITIIEPNDSYTCPEKRWAKVIEENQL